MCDKALEIAASVHPAWDKCSWWAKQLHARNVYQVLGKDLNTPSDLLVCWTKYGEEVGGTATAIKLAKLHNISVCNIGDYPYGHNYFIYLKEIYKNPIIKNKTEFKQEFQCRFTDETDI